MPEAGLAGERLKGPLQSFFYNAGIVLALVIIMALGALSYSFWNLDGHYDKWEEHAYLVMQNISGVLSDMKDAETGQRGYLITGNVKYLEPYRTGMQHIRAQLEVLRQLTKDNPGRQKNIDTLGFLVGEKLSELEQTVNLRNANGFDAAARVVMTDKGRLVMDAIRLKIAQARDEETSLLQKRKTAKENFRNNLAVCLIVGGTLSIVLLVVIFILLGGKMHEGRRPNGNCAAIRNILKNWSKPGPAL